MTLGNPMYTVLDGSRYSHGEGKEFDAAFTKLLWPQYIIIVVDMKAAVRSK